MGGSGLKVTLYWAEMKQVAYEIDLKATFVVETSLELRRRLVFEERASIRNRSGDPKTSLYWSGQLPQVRLRSSWVSPPESETWRYYGGGERQGDFRELADAPARGRHAEQRRSRRTTAVTPPRAPSSPSPGHFLIQYMRNLFLKTTWTQVRSIGATLKTKPPFWGMLYLFCMIVFW